MIHFEACNFDELIKKALEEDIGNGDHTSLSCIPLQATGKARLIVKQEGILAGIELSKRIFELVDSRLSICYFLKDGSPIKFGDIAFELSGPVHSILVAERLVLNCMQRMSGIATVTHAVVETLKGTKTRVLDTRKTTPGLRLIEKWAVKIGGGMNHRIGLYDGILIKDNHVDYAGGIAKAIAAAVLYKNSQEDYKLLPIVIETRNITEVQAAIDAGGINRIMLDNFSFETLKTAVSLIGDKYETEASGGITPENVRAYADCGVDFVSMGALTHSVASLDMSLKAFN
jgi:nicotinate-nucleotide pyrophosphorylase (carboxylating)